MRCIISALLILSCFLGMISAAPAALESDSEDGRDKRGGEVIFFENSQGEDNTFKKRSNEWQQPVEQTKNDGYKPFDVSLNEELKKEKENEVLSELEKWAFDEAFDYLVNQLIAEAYQEELDSLPAPAEATAFQEPVEEMNEMTTFKVPHLFDDEEDALAELLANRNRPEALPPYVQPPVEIPADVDDSSSLEMEEDVDNESEELEDQLTMESEDSESEEDSREKEFGDEEGDGLDSYDIVDIMDYLDYLNQLRRAYSKGGAKREGGEVDSQAHSRKRRSLSAIDEWMDGANGEGVCFTADEARELKSLLISLAKDRAMLKELTSYLSDDRSASPLLKGGYPVYERRYDFNPYNYGSKK